LVAWMPNAIVLCAGLTALTRRKARVI